MHARGVCKGGPRGDAVFIRPGSDDLLIVATIWAAVRSGKARTGSAARWAFPSVVRACLWPSTFPIMNSGCPSAIHCIGRRDRGCRHCQCGPRGKTPREALEAEAANLEARAAELTAAIEGRTAAKADPLARRAEVARQLDAEGPLVRPVLSRGPARATTGR